MHVTQRAASDIVQDSKPNFSTFQNNATECLQRKCSSNSIPVTCESLTVAEVKPLKNLWQNLQQTTTRSVFEHGGHEQLRNGEIFLAP
jgi:hypothetical protein